MAIILNRLQKKGPGRCFLWMLVACWLGIAAQSQAQTPTAAPAPPWTVETLVTRTLSDGQPATMAVALRVPVNEFIKHVVLYTSPNTAPSLKIASGKTGLNLTAPWVRASALLNARGIVVVFADAPSDVKGTAPGKRASADARQDIQAAVAYLQKRFAGLFHFYFNSEVICRTNKVDGVT